MRCIVAGLGIQGAKRLKFAGSDAVATVDPIAGSADYKSVQDVPLDAYDAALLCIPDEPKIQLITYLLENKKHVLVEKPLFAANSDELETLQALSENNNTCCYTAYNHRFEPHIAKIKDVVSEGFLGKVYSVRIFYGNGTARDVRNSEWRDCGMGVLADLGSHILDTLLFVLGHKNFKLQPWRFSAIENNAYDHIVFGATEGDLRIQCEATLLSWRNSFALQIIGENGSADINCLCKWGPSSLTVRKRVLPSGKPDEEVVTLSCTDPTWELEYEHFKSLCAQDKAASNLSTDIWINNSLHKLFET